MKRRLAFLFAGILCLASGAVGQSLPASTSTHFINDRGVSSTEAWQGGVVRHV